MGPEHLSLRRFCTGVGRGGRSNGVRAVSPDARWGARPSPAALARGGLIDGIWLVHVQPRRSFKTKLSRRIFKLGMSLGNNMFPSLTVFPGVKCTNSKDEK